MLIATLVLLGTYVALIAWLPPGSFIGSDQGIKFLQIDALARTGRLAVGPGTDPLSVFRPAFLGSSFHLIGGQYEVKFSPAYAALVVPFYVLLGMRGLSLVSALGAVLAGFASGQLSAILGARRPWVVVLVVGLATPMVYYATVLWEHALMAGLLALAAYLALRPRSYLAGLPAGLAVWLRPEAYVFAPALVLAFVAAFGVRNGVRRTISFGLLYLVGLAPWWIYNALTVEDPVGLHAQDATMPPPSRFGLFVLSRELSLQYNFLPISHGKWLALLALIAVLLVTQALRRRSWQPALWLFWFGVTAIVSANVVTGGSWFRDASNAFVGNSLTDVFPFAFAALACLAAAFKSPKLAFLWVLAVAYAAGVAALAPFNWGIGWGPRYMMGIYPIIGVLAWLGFEATKEPIGRVAMGTLLAVSLIVQSVGIRQVDALGQGWLRLDADLLTLRPAVVATSIWWLPMVAAPTNRQIEWIGLDNQTDLRTLELSHRTFWWVWTSGIFSRNEDKPLTARTPNLPDPRLSVRATRQFSVQGINAVLYEVVQ